MDRFPDEIVDHYDREIDEGQRITRGLRQLELLRTREIVRRHLSPPPGGSWTSAAAPGCTPPGWPPTATTST